MAANRLSNCCSGSPRGSAPNKTITGNLIVVTHPAVIRAAIVCAIEATPQSFRRIDIVPLSVTRVSSADGRWNLTSSGYIGTI